MISATTERQYKEVIIILVSLATATVAAMSHARATDWRTQSRINAAIYRVWKVTSDCGRSFVRWGLWTALLAVVYAAAYLVVDVDLGAHPTPLSTLYFSVVTLTTLGYGDVLPRSLAAQCLVMSEVTVGYVMLGGLLSIFANKMARRAD